MFAKKRIILSILLAITAPFSSFSMGQSVPMPMGCPIFFDRGGVDEMGRTNFGIQFYERCHQLQANGNEFHTQTRTPSPPRSAYQPNTLNTIALPEGMRLIHEANAHSSGIDITSMESVTSMNSLLEKCGILSSDNNVVMDSSPVYDSTPIDISQYVESNITCAENVISEKCAEVETATTTMSTDAVHEVQGERVVQESNFRFSEPDRHLVEIEDSPNQTREGSSIRSVAENTVTQLAMNASLIENKEVNECKQVLGIVKAIISPSTTLKSLAIQMAFLDRKLPMLENVIDIYARQRVRGIMVTDRNGTLAPTLTAEKSAMILKELAPSLLKYCEKTGNKQLLLDLVQEQINQNQHPILYEISSYLKNDTDVFDKLGDFGGSVASFFSSRFNRHICSDHNKVSNQPFASQLNTVVNLCYDGKFEEAEQAANMRGMMPKPSGTQSILAAQTQSLKTIVDEQKNHELSGFGIKLKCQNDPLLAQTLPAIRSGTIKGERLAKLQQDLEQRHEQYCQIRSHILVSEKNLTATDRSLIYKMAQVGADREKQIQVLLDAYPSTSTASKFQYFLNPHYSEMTRSIQYPQGFFDNKEARLAYALYSTIKIESSEGVQLGRQGVSLIMQSHYKTGPMAQDYLYVADKIRDHLLGKSNLNITTSDWLKLNFAQGAFSSEKQNEMKDRLISVVADKLRNLEKSLTSDSLEAQQLVDDVTEVFEFIKQNKLDIAESIIDGIAIENQYIVEGTEGCISNEINSDFSIIENEKETFQEPDGNKESSQISDSYSDQANNYEEKIYAERDSRQKQSSIENEKKQGNNNQSNQGPEKKDDKNKEDNKTLHPHGKYENAKYHHPNSSGVKSRAPKNGQRALDNSALIKPTSPRRVGVSEGEIVILSQTIPGLYHGYAVSWSEILSSPAMNEIRNTLIRTGLVDKCGRILV